MQQSIIAGHYYQTLKGLEAAIGKDIPSHVVSIDEVKFFALEVTKEYVLADIPFIPVPVRIPNAFVRSKNLEES